MSWTSALHEGSCIFVRYNDVFTNNDQKKIIGKKLYPWNSQILVLRFIYHKIYLFFYFFIGNGQDAVTIQTQNLPNCQSSILLIFKN